MSLHNKTAGVASSGGENALVSGGRKSSKGNSRAAQSIETVPEIEKSYSAKVRISISNWRARMLVGNSRNLFSEPLP
jgi:hypothetical protein